MYGTRVNSIITIALIKYKGARPGIGKGRSVCYNFVGNYTQILHGTDTGGPFVGQRTPVIKRAVPFCVVNGSGFATLMRCLSTSYIPNFSLTYRIQSTLTTRLVPSSSAAFFFSSSSPPFRVTLIHLSLPVITSYSRKRSKTRN